MSTPVRTTRYTVPGEFLVFSSPQQSEAIARQSGGSVTPIGRRAYLVRAESDSLTADELTERLRPARVLPNFYITPQHGHSIGGGPASKPDVWKDEVGSRFAALKNETDLRQTALHFTIGAGDSALIDADRATPRIPVRVYVLDTAPEQEYSSPGLADYAPDFIALADLQAGFKVWNKLKARMKVTPLNALMHTLGDNHMCDETDCFMNAHGLFAAGVISAIAPNAEVQLIPIFNANGVGTMGMLIDALEAVRDDPFDGIKIVNCSFTIYIPAEQAHRDADAAQYRRYGLTLEVWEDRLLTDLAAQSRFRPFIAQRDDNPDDMLGAIYNDLLFVAAAGNDAADTSTVPGRRWPARYRDVLAVTALGPDGTTRAPYANTLYPAQSGAVVPGFGVTGTVSSLFLSDRKNKTLSIAEWQGTSFAASVMSGIVASLITGDRVPAGLPLPAPDSVAEALFVLKALATWDDAVGGYTLKVSQDKPPMPVTTASA